MRYYTHRESLHCEEHRVTTGDGFILVLHRIVPLTSTTTTTTSTTHTPAASPVTIKHPVLLQHGLFMSSGVFVTNEESSLAFYLLDKGFGSFLDSHFFLECSSS